MKKSKNKWITIQTMLVIFTFGLCLEQSKIQVSATEGETSILSTGSIVYKNGTDSVAIYAEDIALLKEKLCRVRAEIYDPASYGHDPQQKSTDIAGHIHAENHGLYDFPAAPANRLTETAEPPELPDDPTESTEETPEPPKEETEASEPSEEGTEPPTPQEEGTDTGIAPPAQPETGAESPVPPETGQENEPPDPPKETTEEMPPASFEKEAADTTSKNEGGNE